VRVARGRTVGRFTSRYARLTNGLWEKIATSRHSRAWLPSALLDSIFNRPVRPGTPGLMVRAISSTFSVQPHSGQSLYASG
jgi:hypothetical protein